MDPLTFAFSLTGIILGLAQTALTVVALRYSRNGGRA